MPEANSNILTTRDLTYLLMDSLKTYSDNSFLVDAHNPRKFTVNDKPLYIYIKNTISSGRQRPDEARIEIGKNKTFSAVLKATDIVFFVGYSSKYQVFTAWDPVRFKARINKKKNVSAFSSFPSLEKASKQGISIYIYSNTGERVISFRPEYIGLYLENFSHMYKASESALLRLIKESDKTEKSESATKDIKIENTKYVLTKRKPPRDPAFREGVNEAYDSACGFSGLQLSLSEAAHIIPHSHPEGTDDVANGLCLSPIHHRAFDSGLIYLDANYNIKVNQARVNYLKKIGKGGGLDKFLELQYKQLKLPKTKTCYPSKAYIIRANQIRGIPN